MKKIKKNKILIADLMKTLRKTKEITLEQLASSTNIPLETLKNYEQDFSFPNLTNLLSLSSFFEISVDYFILQSTCAYIRSLKLITCGDKIDKLDQTKRYQVEMTIESLLNKDSLRNYKQIKLDTIEYNLSENFNTNMKTILEKNEISQKEIANYLGVDSSVISYYKSKSVPPVEKLIKLSELFNMSIHSLITGKKLVCNYLNKSLQNSIFKADYLLSNKDKEILLYLMTRIIEDS